MLDIVQLRKDLNAVIARLETRKQPQPYLDVAQYSALEAERKTLQTRTEELQSQQQELKNTNDRLEQQAASLRQSEELLKSQREELQLRGQPDLAQEPLGPHRSSQLRVQRLDGDPAGVLRVVRKPDRRHPAAPDLALYRIPVPDRDAAQVHGDGGSSRSEVSRLGGQINSGFRGPRCRSGGGRPP